MRTNKRFEKHFIAFFDFVRSSRRLVNGRITWHQRPEYMAARRWYRCRSVSGGGVVLGMGIHYLDLFAELSADAVIQNATTRVYRCSPNAPDTTSENYAKLDISSSRMNLQLTLSGWKPKTSLPDERIVVFDSGRRFSFKRQVVRDVKSELSCEFQYYCDVILRGDFHPQKPVIIKAHELAFKIYEKAGQTAEHQ